MVESVRESLELNQGCKIYENMTGESGPTKFTSNVGTLKNSFVQSS